MHVAPWQIISVGLLASLLAGFAAASGSVLSVGAFLALIIIPLIVISPRLVFGATLFFSMVLAGIVEFYFYIGTANWFPSVLGFALFPAAFFSHRLATSSSAEKTAVSSISWLVIVYVCSLFVSSALNLNSLLQFAVGIRNYVPFLGVFLALVTFAGSDRDLRFWVLGLLAIGLLQFPFVIHQQLFVVPVRNATLQSVGGGVEAIVGTFGGDPFGGGYTGEMAVFVLIASLMAMSLASVLRHGTLLAWVMCVFAMGCIGFAETKIVFLMAPIAVLIVFSEEIRSSPKRMFQILFGTISVLIVLGGIYTWRFWDDSSGGMWQAFTYSFDPNFMVTKDHRGRMAALIHWWNNIPAEFDFLHTFFGYGLASTLETSRILGEGSAVKIFGLGLDAHAASKMLWDGGVLGFFILCWIIFRTFFNANYLVKATHLPAFHRRMMKVSRATMFCFFAMLPYQISILGGAPMQFIFWFFVGYVEYCRLSILRGAYASV